VTGAASGIGEAIVDAYAREGARLLLADLDAEGLERVKERYVAVSTATVDVTDPGQTRAMVDQCLSELGAIDVLVNSAGTLNEVALVDMDVATWDQMIAIDLRERVPVLSLDGAAHGRPRGRADHQPGQSARHQRRRGHGALLRRQGRRHRPHERTRARARAARGAGNAIAPGPIESPMVGGISNEWKQAKLPLRRFGRADEVAPSAVLLASDPGGNLYVGQVLGPNSGDVMP
jgi:3-oxoacyl-[acyl-carrier protein] reductase